MQQSPSKLSIVIVVKHDRGIANTLDGIKAQSCDVPYETIVIDGSEPSELWDIRIAHPWVRWRQFPFTKKRTTPQQRNMGITMSSGDVVVFIDANCIPADGWLQGIVTSLREGRDIVCGPVEDISKHNLVHYAPELGEGKFVDICTTINVAIRRTVFQKVGGFDTSFSFGQDIDFFWRAKDAGFRIYYNPAVAIGHDWGEPKEQVGRAFNYGEARAHLYRKHWRTHSRQLLREPHVWMYPVFMLGLPLTILFPFYPLLLLVPVAKNFSRNPWGVIVHHLSYGAGVIVGAVRVWPKGLVTLTA